MATKSFADVMASKNNGRRTAMVDVCFSPVIAREFSELAVELEEAERVAEAAKRADKPAGNRRLGASPTSQTIATKMAALVDANPDAFFELKMQALPRAEWIALRNQHAPRDGVDADGGLFNSDTFAPAAVEACLVDPEPTPEALAFLDESLTNGEWERLTLIAWGLNEGSREAPKLDRALSILNGNATA